MATTLYPCDCCGEKSITGAQFMAEENIRPFEWEDSSCYVCKTCYWNAAMLRKAPPAFLLRAGHTVETVDANGHFASCRPKALGEMTPEVLKI